MGTTVVLVGMPTLLRQLVHGVIDTAPDLDIEVDELPDDALTSADLRDRDVDLVILDTAEATDSIVEEFLAEHCHVKVLGVSADGRRGLLHEMRPQRVLVGELSPEVLVRIVASSNPGPSHPRGCG